MQWNTLAWVTQEPMIICISVVASSQLRSGPRCAVRCVPMCSPRCSLPQKASNLNGLAQVRLPEMQPPLGNSCPANRQKMCSPSTEMQPPLGRSSSLGVQILQELGRRAQILTHGGWGSIKDSFMTRRGQSLIGEMLFCPREGHLERLRI